MSPPAASRPAPSESAAQPELYGSAQSRGKKNSISEMVYIFLLPVSPAEFHRSIIKTSEFKERGYLMGLFQLHADSALNQSSE